MARNTRPQPSNLPARRPDDDNRMALITRAINDRRRALAEILPGGFSPERMVALCLQSFRRTPQLAQCDVDSILCAMFEAAKLGLEPDTPMNLCHLVPYKSECQFVLGYQGAKVLVARSGDIAKVWAEHRFAADDWMLVRGTRASLHHVPADDPRGDYLGTYAVAEYRDPRVKPSFEYVPLMDMDSIEAHAHGCALEQLEETRKRAESDWKKAKKPWIRWRDRMRLKTAIKRLCKQLIAYDQLGAEARRAILLDDLAEGRKSQAGVTQLPPPDNARLVAVPDRVLVGDTIGDRAVDDAAAERARDDVKPDNEGEGEGEGDELDAGDAQAGEVETDPLTDEQADAIAGLARSITEEHEDLRQRVAAIVIDAISPEDKMAKLEALKAQADGKLSPEEEAAMERAAKPAKGRKGGRS